LKIIDFGIAHAMSEEMRLTRTGTFIGTPSFMSPEQAGGGAIDHRADFFGFGCILYELTTGKRPFDRANIISTLSAIATHTPERPIDLQPELPQDLSDLIMDLLEKSPSKRPGDCQEILSRVRAIARDLN
jgi:serine/threonine protein kinase